MKTTFDAIEKEQIGTLKFPSNDVLNDAQLINERNSDLSRALSLGNLEHTKIKIYFDGWINCFKGTYLVMYKCLVQLHIEIGHITTANNQ